MQLNATDAVTAIADLIEAGYIHDFRIRDGQIVDVGDGTVIDPAGLTDEARLRYATDDTHDDASNVYVLLADGGVRKGFLIDAHALDGEGAPQSLVSQLRAAEGAVHSEGAEESDLRYGVRKVRRPEFNADPDRYVLRIGFPDFPPCPFGQGFSMLGYDTARQEYVWLATKIIRDDRLQRIPYNEADQGNDN